VDATEHVLKPGDDDIVEFILLGDRVYVVADSACEDKQTDLKKY